MDAIKPYLFWIVIAICCLAVVGVGYVLEPSYNGKNVQDMTQDLNRNFKSLEALARKADHQLESYPTNDPAKFDELKEESLVTRKWEGGLRLLKNDYEGQLRSIKEELLRRSAMLTNPITSATDRGDWYFAYQDTTGEWLQQLYKEGLVAMPRGAFGTQGQATYGLEDFKTQGNLRNPMGLYTLVTSSSSVFPEQSTWHALTLQFRILEQIATCLRQVRVEPKANPNMRSLEKVGDLVPSPTTQRVVMQGLTWTGGGGTSVSEVPVTGGVAVECTLKVNGAPAAILALGAALDAQVEPMMVVRGVSWRQPKNAAQGEANAVDTIFEAEIHLAVLRFTDDGLTAIGQSGGE